MIKPLFAKMRLVAESSFFDTCTIDKYVETKDGFGDIHKAWVSGSPIACGVEMTGGEKKYTDETTTTKYSGKVRLSLSTAISSKDRITINGNQYIIKNILIGKTCFVVLIDFMGV